MKAAFLFPGQGSQYVGMGKGLLISSLQARRTFEQAETVLHRNLRRLCLRGPEEELVQTENLQPLLVTLSFAISQVLEQNGLHCQAVAGHSLGEYASLAYANSIGFSDTLRLVSQRARLMAAAGQQQEGAMAAIIGLQAKETRGVCNQLANVWVANYNCPGQQVISGKVPAVAQAGEALKQAGAKRVIPLAVSGAFHCPLMDDAARQFQGYLAQLSFRAPEVPLVSNASGDYARSPQQMLTNLSRQMNHAVLWEASMRRLRADGFNTFIEVGPGKVLQGLLRRIDRHVRVVGVNGSPGCLQQVQRLVEHR